jgi:hypothetical protein
MDIEKLRARIKSEGSLNAVALTDKEYAELAMWSSCAQFAEWRRARQTPDCALQIGPIQIFVSKGAELEAALTQLAALLPDD